MPAYGFKALTAALLCGFVLSWIPLLREVHFLSAGLVGLIGAYTAAYIAAKRTYTRKPAAGLKEAFGLVLIFLAPLLPMLAGALWRGCFSADGLSFWLLIPGPSVLLGFALGRYMSLHTARPRFYTLAVLTFVAAGIFVREFFSYPAVFYHNHVWGFWPGPIYDDVVELRPSLVLFRYITLCWAALLWLMPHWHSRKNLRLPLLLLTLSLMLSYLNLARAGILHSETWIQQQLGGKLETEYAVLFYDRQIDAAEIEWLAAWHDFHIRELAEILTLDLSTLPKTHSYLYRHEWQKKQLTGAGGTVYVPVWLRQPQMHIHWQAAERVLRHELVHVLAREFGAPVINASPVIALVEGLATAFETERDPRGTADQLVAAQTELPTERYMRRLMSLTGFYALDGTLSYTIAGSFTGWLWQHCGTDAMKQAYATGRISHSCAQPFGTLVEGWHAHLQTVETDSLQFALSGRLFAAPGIADAPCSFHPSQHHRDISHIQMLIAENRQNDALIWLETQQSDLQFCGFNRLSLVRANLLMHAGNAQPEALLNLMQGCETSPEELPASLRLLVADALMLSGSEHQALKLLGSLGSDSEAVRLRTDEQLQTVLLELLYEPTPFIPAYIAPDLKPWVVWHCTQHIHDEGCRTLDPGVFITDSRRHFVIWENYIRALYKFHSDENAADWVATLESRLDNPVSDQARLLRLNELSRFSAIKKKGSARL
ncbi:MAG: hypothetical protein JJU35_02090 [Balneolales bacterium]|nr:hypothetical protein [Balneolales bacterium]